MSKGQPSLILEIQAAAIESGTDVVVLLRKAKAAAIKLDQNDAVIWIDQELNGYPGGYDSLPDYRLAQGQLKARNPYHGLIPIFYRDQETEKLLSRAPIFDGMASIKKVLDNSSPGEVLQYNLPSGVRQAIIETMEISMEPVLVVSYGVLENIVSRVISLVLDWSLELERAGILGEGMSFSMSEKEKATSVTQNIFAQNVGNVGAANESQKVNIGSMTAGDINIDQRKLDNFIEEADATKGMLPPELLEAFSDELEKLKASDDPANKRAILGSIRHILEGASGSVVAQGLIQLISTIF